MNNINFQSNANISTMLEKTIMQVLKKNSVLKGNKTFGTIEEILDDSTVMVFIDQANEVKEVNCNPRIEYVIGDRVIVEYINNNPHDMYIMGLISEGSGVTSDYYDNFPYEPVEILYDEDWRAYKFIYGYNDPKTTWTQELVRGGELNKVMSIISTYPDGFILTRNLIRHSNGKLNKYE